MLRLAWAVCLLLATAVVASQLGHRVQPTYTVGLNGRPVRVAGDALEPTAVGWGERPTPPIRYLGEQRSAPNWWLRPLNSAAACAAAPGCGANVTILQVDGGADWRNPDLGGVDSAASFNFHDASASALPDDTPSGMHGSAAAAMAIGANNTFCGIGVAPGARLVAVRMLVRGARVTQASLAASLARIPDWDVASFSLGPADTGLSFEPVTEALDAALVAAAVANRTVVWAAGNGHASGDGMWLDGAASHWAVFAVGAAGADGYPTTYTEYGFVLCAAMSSDSFQGVAAAVGPSSCNQHYGGTSAAAPQIAGVLALMKAAAPALTWADALEIVVEAAQRNRVAAGRALPTQTNAAGLWFNDFLGFGIPDAALAVQLAAARTEHAGHALFEYSGATHVTYDDPVFHVEINVTRNSTVLSAAMRLDLEFGACSLDHVEEMFLISPAETRARVVGPNVDFIHHTMHDLRVGSRFFMYEGAAGTWTLVVRHSCPSILVTGTPTLEIVALV